MAAPSQFDSRPWNWCCCRNWRRQIDAFNILRLATRAFRPISITLKIDTVRQPSQKSSIDTNRYHCLSSKRISSSWPIATATDHSSLTRDFLLLHAPQATGILRRFCGLCGVSPAVVGAGVVGTGSSSGPISGSSSLLVGNETRIESAMVHQVGSGLIFADLGKSINAKPGCIDRARG